MHSVDVWLEQVKCRFGPEMKQDLLQFSWSWRPGVAVDLLASSYVVVDCMILAAVSVDVLGGGTEGCLEDCGTRGNAELREETPFRGAIFVGARGGLGVNREIVGGGSEEDVSRPSSSSEPHRSGAGSVPPAAE
ncbi:hypothetical protein Taro_043404 [Colocasia esculenta]|uniref:Uncharacterized protein n=1 Tax=Colocasia esculenta TaxID=4460 RepID=A0A843WRA7_COLES|nr:hypothetical protein [Colocasia esculenta]